MNNQHCSSLMKKSPLIVANWKNYRTHQQTLDFFTHHAQDLNSLVTSSSSRLVICPLVTTISTLAPRFTGTPLLFGSQTCSPFGLGAHTGDVDAQSLAEIGCSYSIVGHSERRIDHHETAEQIAHQVLQLVTHGITPIICVGESLTQKEAGQTQHAISEYLTQILQELTPHTPDSTLIIAYEPVWAIGSTITPTTHDIKQVFDTIAHITAHKAPRHTFRIMYGGNVTPTTMHELRTLKNLDGFLVGRASLTIENLQALCL